MKKKQFIKLPINYSESVNKSAELVRLLGKAKIDNKSLSEFLTIDGINYWELFSPKLSIHHVNNILGSDKLYSQSLAQYLIRKLKIIRLALSHWKNYFYFIINKNKEIDNLKKVKKHSIMFLAFSKHLYRDALMPITINSLLKNKNKVLISEFNNQGLNHSESLLFINPWTIWDKQSKLKYANLKNILKRLKTEFNKSNFLETSIPSELKDKNIYFSYMFDDLFDLYFPHILFQIITAQKILKKYPPSIIISPDVSDPRTRIYSMLCHSLKIPSIELQSGLYGNEAVEWQFLTSDYVLPWGETTKNYMIDHGVHKDKIIVSGSPRHDFKYKLTKADIQKKRKEFEIPANKSIFLLASTFNDKHHSNYANPDILDSMKESIYKSTMESPNIVLIVKPHPFENPESTKKIIKEVPNKIIYADRKCDIRELIHISDTFLSFGSTTTIDAIIANKFVICPIFPGWVFSSLIKDLAHYQPDNHEDMFKIFKSFNVKFSRKNQYLNSSSIKKSLEKLIYKYDNLSTKRVSKIILKKIHN